MVCNNSIARIFEKFVNNTCTTEEVELLIREFGKPDARERFGLLFDDFWNKIDTIQEYAGVYRFADNETDYILKLAKREEFRTSSSRKMLVKSVLSVAAGFAMLVGLWVSYFYFTKPSTDKVVMLEEKVGFGKLARIHLQDGSQIKLNAGSRLIYPSAFNSNKREIQLQGHAFFRVHKEPKPFVVKAGIIDVTVMGTSFDVKSFPGESYSLITVVTGRVKVKINGKQGEFILIPGQQLIVDNRTKTGRIKIVKSNVYGEWEQPTLVFDNTPLSDVFSNLERYYNVTIVRPRDYGASCTVTGEHRNENLESVLKALHYLYNVQYIQRNDSVFLTGTGCK